VNAKKEQKMGINTISKHQRHAKIQRQPLVLSQETNTSIASKKAVKISSSPCLIRFLWKKGHISLSDYLCIYKYLEFYSYIQKITYTPQIKKTSLLNTKHAIRTGDWIQTELADYDKTFNLEQEEKALALLKNLEADLIKIPTQLRSYLTTLLHAYPKNFLPHVSLYIKALKTGLTIIRKYF
jgi:hypothetical protein